jgi:binding-protein-dependent transport system inner membrane component
MTNIANSEANLGAAVRSSGGRSILVARALFLAAILATWQGAVAAGLASAAFISTPAGVAQSLWHLFKQGEVLPDLGTTVLEIVIAFALSVVFGIATAVVLDRNDWLNRIVSPFLTAFNSMPRIALGPLFVLWFGIGIASKVVLAFSLGYFIMLLSTLGGLKNVDRDLLLLAAVWGVGAAPVPPRPVSVGAAGHLCGAQTHPDLLQRRRRHRRDDRGQERPRRTAAEFQRTLRRRRRPGADSHRRLAGDGPDIPLGPGRTPPP